MIIGYCRVSTQDQSLEVQQQAIINYAESIGEPHRIYSEKESGGKTNRIELTNALKALQPGNKFVVFKLDRLARSTKQLYEIADQLNNNDVEFVSINDNIDTTTATGKAMFGMLAVFAEFERSMIQERTQAGLDAAKRQGRKGGRPVIDNETKRKIIALKKGDERVVDIAKEYNVGRSTVYKILNEEK